MRKLALLLLPVALIAAACGGGGGKTSTKTSTPKPTATAAVRSATTSATATTVVIPQPAALATKRTATSGDAASALFDTVNPFQLLGGLSGAPSSTDVDPSLKNALLDESDLPAGFPSIGAFSYDLPTRYGSVQMAANIFTKGDFTSGQFGAMVMSASIALPPDALAEFNAMGGFDQLENFSDADLRDLQGAAEAYGVSFGELRVLDGSGLGDGGVGMHLVMDFSGLTSAFGASEQANPFAAGLAMDMYIFLRGDHMLMTMVMWPAGQSSGVDGRDLAEKLDANATKVF